MLDSPELHWSGEPWPLSNLDHIYIPKGRRTKYAGAKERTRTSDTWLPLNFAVRVFLTTLFSIALPTELLPHVYYYLSRYINIINHDVKITAFMGAAELNRKLKFSRLHLVKLLWVSAVLYTYITVSGRSHMVLATGLEPVWCFHRRILSPLCLPIPTTPAFFIG